MSVKPRNDCGREREERIKRKMQEMLEQGAAEYNYLRGLVFDNETADYMLEQLGRLFDHLIKEKQAAEQKYDKLLELHNNLIDSAATHEERYSAEYIYKLADENEYLKAELSRIMVKSSTQAPAPDKASTAVAESEKMRERLELLEQKLVSFERERSPSTNLRQNVWIGAASGVERARKCAREKVCLRRKNANNKSIN